MRLWKHAALVVAFYAIATVVFAGMALILTPVTARSICPLAAGEDCYLLIQSPWPAAFQTGALLAGLLTGSALLIHAAIFRE